MPFNKESFAPMKEEVSELRGIIAEFLSLTDPEESDWYRAILEYVDNLSLTRRRRSRDLEVVRYIGTSRARLDHQMDQLMLLDRWLDRHPRIENAFASRLLAMQYRRDLEVVRLMVESVIRETKDRVEFRIAKGSALPAGQVLKN